ncbi:hypothetical protein [Thermoplasma volcanium]|nr:hypothetical protein [Thermoplasma volcanium]
MIQPRTLVLAKKTPELRKALKLDEDTEMWSRWYGSSSVLTKTC